MMEQLGYSGLGYLLMKKALLSAGAALILVGCENGVENGPSKFVVRVDSLAHPAIAGLNDTVNIQFFGTIGSNGCYSFSGFEAAGGPLQLDMTVWGHHEEAEACPTVMVYLDGKEFRYVPHQSGWCKINVHEPDNTVLRDSMFIR